MRNLVAALVSASALALVPTSAGAVELIEEFNPGDTQFQIAGDIDEGPLTAGISVVGIDEGEFTHTFLLTTGFDGLASGSITTSATSSGSTTDTDFLSILVNGSNIGIDRTENNLVETGSVVDVPITANQENSIIVRGISRGNGSYGGNLTFTPLAAPVPEPGTWAMMLFGFGALGFAMRRRRKDNVRVRFAF